MVIYHLKSDEKTLPGSLSGTFAPMLTMMGIIGFLTVVDVSGVADPIQQVNFNGG